MPTEKRVRKPLGLTDTTLDDLREWAYQQRATRRIRVMRLAVDELIARRALGQQLLERLPHAD